MWFVLACGILVRPYGIPSLFLCLFCRKKMIFLGVRMSLLIPLRTLLGFFCSILGTFRVRLGTERL